MMVYDDEVCDEACELTGHAILPFGLKLNQHTCYVLDYYIFCKYLLTKNI